jgi:hypothetical protein
MSAETTMAHRSTSPLPETVILCGIRYRVSEHEGAVIFSEALDLPCASTKLRLMFTRDRHDTWEVEITPEKSACVGRIVSAAEYCKKWRGADWSK